MTERAITAEMPIGDVVRKHPESIAVFFNHGLHCIGCQVAAYESIAQGAAAHGIDVEALVDELNAAVSEAAAQGDEEQKGEAS